MDMTEKNGQPSMEEILASIRRIIAEEPADAISIDLNAKSGAAAHDAALEEHSEFELPSMFRPASSNANEKPAPLFGRLTDAIRGAAHAATGDRSASPAETEPATASEHEFPHGRSDQNTATYPALSALRTARTETTAPEKRTETPAPTRMSAAPVDPANDPATYFATHSNMDMKREMASFMDTRFSGMAAPTNVHSAPVVSQPVHVQSPQPAPVEPTQPAVDFGSIVPGRLTRPVDTNVYTPPPLNNGYQNPYGMVDPGYRAPQPDMGAVPPAGGGGLEDSTAELLRPMLRQWLAENMPRMVEKALHIEVAESVKPGGKRPG